MPIFTVSPGTLDNTSQLTTPQTASVGGSQTTITDRQPLEKSTKTGSASIKSTFSKSTTLVLISVFVIFSHLYFFRICVNLLSSNEKLKPLISK